MHIMMMSMMGTNNNGRRAGMENNVGTNNNGEGIAEDNRKPAAKTDKESEMEDGGAEC